MLKFFKSILLHAMTEAATELWLQALRALLEHSLQPAWWQVLHQSLSALL